MKIFLIILTASLISCTARNSHITTKYIPERPAKPRVQFCIPDEPGCLNSAVRCVDERNYRSLYEREQILNGHIVNLENLIRDLQSGRVQ